MSLLPIPVSLSQANRFVDLHHRHHEPLAATAEKHLFDGAPHLSEEIFQPGRLANKARSSYPSRALHVRG